MPQLAPHRSVLTAVVLLALGAAAADDDLRPWTAADAAAHADRYNDPAAAREVFMANDLAMIEQMSEREIASLPFPYVAFPTPDYEATGREMPGIGVGPIPIEGGPQVQYGSVNRPFDFDSLEEGTNWWEVIEADAVMAVAAAGVAPLEYVEPWAVSRSHPHYFFQGAYVSEHGEIDWIALRLADGTEIGVVNGRVIDLSQGNLILVHQAADGSIRLHQVRERLPGGRVAELHAQVAEQLAGGRARAFFE